MRNVGIYYAFWTNQWDADFKPFIPKVKRLGFDQLELNGGTLVNMSSSERKELKSMADAEGLALSYGIGLKKEYDPSSLDETVRNRGVDFMKRMIDAVAEMGGGTIGGTVHSYWPASLPEDQEDKQPIWDQSIKSMKELAPYAGERGVTLAVEVINRFESFLMNEAREAVAYVNEVNHSSCGILLDTFHMNIEEESLGGAIRLAGKHLVSLHIGETNRNLPGTGRMPWGEIKQALDDIGYDGPIVMEPFIMKGGEVGRNIAVWRNLIENPDLDALAAKSAAWVKEHLR